MFIDIHNVHEDLKDIKDNHRITLYRKILFSTKIQIEFENL